MKIVRRRAILRGRGHYLWPPVDEVTLTRSERAAAMAQAGRRNLLEVKGVRCGSHGRLAMPKNDTWTGDEQSLGLHTHGHLTPLRQARSHAIEWGNYLRDVAGLQAPRPIRPPDDVRRHAGPARDGRAQAVGSRSPARRPRYWRSSERLLRGTVPGVVVVLRPRAVDAVDALDAA